MRHAGLRNVGGRRMTGREIPPNQVRSRLQDDPYLAPFLGHLRHWKDRTDAMHHRLVGESGSLQTFASAHEYYGLHRRAGKWIFREWAPHATDIHLTGTFNQWKLSPEFAMTRIEDSGDWQLELPANALHHGDLYKLHMTWPHGHGERIPAYARRVVQDDETKIFSAQVWAPPEPYQWKHPEYRRPAGPALIYEAHVGMALEAKCTGTYREFQEQVLPRVVKAGYNTLQLMAVMEHPYYGSFGYHVSSFFAASSRFGTPEELKSLVDAAHEAGLAVIMDMVHSHSVKNEIEGLSRFDGTPYLYFHDGPRGYHTAWDSRCFDYGKVEVLHFLLSNCRFWLDEYKVDGFRFDGVTSMLYYDHGLGPAFDSYDRYFDGSVDPDALVYLHLANSLIHSLRPDAITIAEDVSGMPGLGAPESEGGCGFDYRLAMGVPDCWFKYVQDVPDEQWNLRHIWTELTNRRGDERTISYAECHDQAIVGGKTLIFSLIDEAMYKHMRLQDRDLRVERGMALHKMIRLATATTANHGYLNFIGNEFGHPEWVDFPRDGNQWSYHHARRQWSLADNPNLKYQQLGAFDHDMMRVVGTMGWLDQYKPRLLGIDGPAGILAFERGGYIFLFNFHPSQSVTDYPVELFPGKYVWKLDTDEARFGGQNRIQAGQVFEAHAIQHHEERHYGITVYLPCRTALVLQYSP